MHREIWPCWARAGNLAIADDREGGVKLRLKILAWCHVVFGAVGLLAFASLIITYAMARDPAYDDEFAWMGGGLGLLSLAYFAPSFLGGLALLRGNPLGRAIIWIESAVLALAVPVGTVICSVSIWVLLTTWDPTEAPTFNQIERFVQNSLRSIVLILVALFLLGVIIGVGYIFRDVIDPPQHQELTPMPTFPPPQVDRPEFKMPELPRAPGQ